MMETLYSIRHSEPMAVEGLDGKMRQMKAERGELLGNIDTKVEYVPVTERVEKAEAFIKLVVVAAEELELNVDIERGDGRVVFRFYDAGVYLGELREFYGYMFKTCDSVAVLPCEGLEGCSFKVVFSYYTHRQFAAGRGLGGGERRPTPCPLPGEGRNLSCRFAAVLPFNKGRLGLRVVGVRQNLIASHLIRPKRGHLPRAAGKAGE